MIGKIFVGVIPLWLPQWVRGRHGGTTPTCAITIDQIIEVQVIGSDMGDVFAGFPTSTSHINRNRSGGVKQPVALTLWKNSPGAGEREEKWFDERLESPRS
jgi:hypothetical protein